MLNVQVLIIYLGLFQNPTDKVCYAQFVEKEKKLQENETGEGEEQKDAEFKRRQTRYGCGPCEAHLCMPTCFTIYHSVSNFGVLPSNKAMTEEYCMPLHNKYKRIIVNKWPTFYPMSSLVFM